MMKTSFGLTALLVLLCAAVAHAQPPDWTLKVKLGKPIFVTTESGERVEGVAGQVTPDGILVATPVGVRTVNYRDLRRVEKRDPVKDGIWIGTAAGFALGLVAILTDSSNCNTDVCRSEEAAVPMGGAIYGALIGWGIDTWIKGRTTLYNRESRTTVAIAPKRGGVVATVTARW